MDEVTLPKGEPPGAYEEMHLAARRRDAAGIARLLAAGGDPNTRNRREPNGDGGNTPLWFAAQGAAPGGVPVAQKLVDAGASIDERCEYGTTALHLAASWAHLDMVQFLISNGADAQVRDDEDRTPLEMARAAQAHVRDEMQGSEAPGERAGWLVKIPAVIDFLSRVR